MLDRRHFLGLLAGIPAILGLARANVKPPPPPTTGLQSESAIEQSKLWFGHDFDPLDFRCKRCGMGEMEWLESRQLQRIYNRKGDLVGQVYHGGLPCLKDDFHGISRS